jgi:hypothetical protein
MCYGVARPELSGREFAGFESVEGGVRGILGFRCQASGVRCFTEACSLLNPMALSEVSGILAV